MRYGYRKCLMMVRGRQERRSMRNEISPRRFHCGILKPVSSVTNVFSPVPIQSYVPMFLTSPTCTKHLKDLWQKRQREKVLVRMRCLISLSLSKTAPDAHFVSKYVRQKTNPKPI